MGSSYLHERERFLSIVITMGSSRIYEREKREGWNDDDDNWHLLSVEKISYDECVEEVDLLTS